MVHTSQTRISHTHVTLAQAEQCVLFKMYTCEWIQHNPCRVKDTCVAHTYARYVRCVYCLVVDDLHCTLNITYRGVLCEFQ